MSIGPMRGCSSRSGPRTAMSRPVSSRAAAFNGTKTRWQNIWSPDRIDRRCSRLVPPDPHQLLAEIGAFQQSHEGRGRAVQSLGDEFLVLDFALAHPLRHVAQEV